MYTLHYAPDNASLIVRLALDHAGVPYDTVLVDRAKSGQRSPAYLALNPNGLIPALETPDGVIFETAAILLWLVERHSGLGPQPHEPGRVDLLKWLIFVSNTLHPALRALFYPDQYISTHSTDALNEQTRANICTHLATLDANLPSDVPPVLAFYLAACMRWLQLYPKNAPHDWFDLARYPVLRNICVQVESLPSSDKLCAAEGMHPNPFTQPHDPNPPEGSAL